MVQPGSIVGAVVAVVVAVVAAAVGKFAAVGSSSVELEAAAVGNNSAAPVY